MGVEQEAEIREKGKTSLCVFFSCPYEHLDMRLTCDFAW